MNGLINGICINKKFYEVVDSNGKNPCLLCELSDWCDMLDNEYSILNLCMGFVGEGKHFHYSQELTDKINKI